MDEYDVTMSVPHVRLTSQINYGDVTMLSQIMPSLATMTKWVIDDLFLAELCVQDIEYRVRNKIIQSLPWITILWSLTKRFANDFQSWLRHSWKLLANRPTRDQKFIIHGYSCIILYILHPCVIYCHNPFFIVRQQYMSFYSAMASVQQDIGICVQTTFMFRTPLVQLRKMICANQLTHV